MPANVVVGRDVDHASFWTIGNRRPSFSAVDAGAKFGWSIGPGLMRRVDVGPARDGIDAADDVVEYVRLAFDELDGTGAALQKPQVPVARYIDQTFDSSPV